MRLTVQLYLSMCPPKKAHGATWRIRLNLCLLCRVGPPESRTQTANQSVQLFLHSLQQKVPILYNERPFPQNCPFHGEIWTPSNTSFLGPIRAHNANGISIGSAIFEGLTSVTDRQTTLLGWQQRTASMYVVHAMRHNNIITASMLLIFRARLNAYLNAHFPSHEFCTQHKQGLATSDDITVHFVHSFIRQPTSQLSSG